MILEYKFIAFYIFSKAICVNMNSKLVLLPKRHFVELGF